MLQDDDFENLLDSPTLAAAPAPPPAALATTSEASPTDSAPASVLAAKAAMAAGDEGQPPLQSFDMNTPPGSFIEEGAEPEAMNLPPTASASASASSAGPSAAQPEDDDDDSQGVEKMFKEAIPVEKLENGMKAAKNLWSWGFGKVVRVPARSMKTSNSLNLRRRPQCSQNRQARRRHKAQRR